VAGPDGESAAGIGVGEGTSEKVNGTLDQHCAAAGWKRTSKQDKK
jgi:hypothetical protein